MRRAGKYGLELKFPGSNEKLAAKFRVETTDPERDDTKPNFALLHRLASDSKDRRTRRNRLRIKAAALRHQAVQIGKLSEDDLADFG